MECWMGRLLVSRGIRLESGCVGSHGPVLRIVPMICLSSTLYEPFLSDSTRYVVGGLQHEGSRESPKTRYAFGTLHANVI